MISRTRSSAAARNPLFEKKQQIYIGKKHTAPPLPVSLPGPQPRMGFFAMSIFGPNDTFFITLPKIVIDKMSVIIQKIGGFSCYQIAR